MKKTARATRSAIVAFPVLDPSDRAWVESVRAESDPQASSIAVHFTLCFPCEVAHLALVDAARSAAARSHSFAFAIKEARAVSAMPEPGGHVFLVPGTGRRELIALYRRLASLDPLTSTRPFVPHLTVAASREASYCTTLAAELDGRVVRGRIEALSIVLLKGESVEVRESLALR